MKKIISTPEAPAAIGPYSQGIKIKNFIYTSGQIPLTPAGELAAGGIAEQTEQAIKNLVAVLAAENATLADVVKTTVFLRSMDDFAAMNEVYARSFAGSPPARTTVAVAALPKDALVEIEAVAYKEEEMSY